MLMALIHEASNINTQIALHIDKNCSITAAALKHNLEGTALSRRERWPQSSCSAEVSLYACEAFCSLQTLALTLTTGPPTCSTGRPVDLSCQHLDDSLLHHTWCQNTTGKGAPRTTAHGSRLIIHKIYDLIRSCTKQPIHL